MRPNALLLTCLGMLVSSLASADGPASSPPSSASPAAATASAAATERGKEPSASAPTAPAMVNGIPAEHERQIRAMGYVPELRHGDVYYCRKEAELGTRFETKVCRPVAEIERATLESRSVTDKIQREGSPVNGK